MTVMTELLDSARDAFWLALEGVMRAAFPVSAERMTALADDVCPRVLRASG